MGDGRDPREVEAARERAQRLARASLEQGAPTAWFEALYRQAGGDTAQIPWADLQANPALDAWIADPASLSGVRTAAVVGCGLGHDAEALAAKGLDVLAFDVSAEAVAWAKRLHPGTRVRYEVGDLFALPTAWRGRFDLVVEVYTIQALPARVRAPAVASILGLLAPGGRLFLFTRVRDDGPGSSPVDELLAGPPWPLGRRELSGYVAGLAPLVPLVEAADPTDARIVRAHGVWVRRA
jgi:SAM-dependent methyltransferase